MKGRCAGCKVCKAYLEAAEQGPLYADKQPALNSISAAIVKAGLTAAATVCETGTVEPCCTTAEVKEPL